MTIKEALLRQDMRPKRGAWAPGDYLCRCSNCGNNFIGDKRALWCASCACGPHLFVDMDGVLADFDAGHIAKFGRPPTREKKGVEWDKIRAMPTFYRDLPPMRGFEELWAYVAPHHPTILTGVPEDNDDAPGNKRMWVDKNIGKDQPMICCQAKEKYLYASRGDILIDDYEKYRALWTTAGGVWITYITAPQVIGALKGMGI